MAKRLSAVDSVSPAFAQTNLQLFKPFRFRHWMRLAAISLVTGEFTGGGGWGGSNFNIPAPHQRRNPSILAFAMPSWSDLHAYLPWIFLGIAVFFAIFVVWLYASSVYRFILFDSVLYNRCDLREGWRRWQKQGSSYFLFMIALVFAWPAAVLLLIGGPIFLAWRAGIFNHPGEHLALLIIGGGTLFFLFFVIILAGAVVTLFAKDFAVPLMALEDLGMMDAWRRLLPMVSAEKGAYAGYVLMKIVLAMGSAILFGIVTLVAIFAMLIPLGVLALVVFLVAKGAGLTWSVTTISVVVVLGGVALVGMFYVMAFVTSPAMVFFQSYPLHFFGSRYPKLGDVLFGPPPPEAQPSPAPIV